MKEESFLMRHRLIFAVVLVILGLLGHNHFENNYSIIKRNGDVIGTAPPPTISVPTTPSIPTTIVEKRSVNSWAYYIRDPQLAPIRNSRFDLVVLDVGNNDIPRFSSSQIESLKEGGRTMLAYVSLGHAENYRAYWQAGWNSLRPEWMGDQNKFWKGNFLVTDLMHPEWLRIAESMVDSAVDQGFDGIMINGLAAQNTIQFVEYITNRVKKRDKNFQVFVQDYVTSGLIPHVDGILKQNVFYKYGVTEQSNSESMLEKIADFTRAGKTVLAVSYTTGSRWNDVKTKLRNRGILPYSAPVRLDAIRLQQ